MSISLSKEQGNAMIEAVTHPKNHPYHKMFLNDMNELHKFVCAVLARGDVNKDFFSLVDAYNCTSELRKYMDKGSQIALDSGHKQCINSIRQDFCYDRPLNQTIDPDAAKWMGTVYNHFQWKYEIMSLDICEHFPAKELYSLYSEMKDMDIDKVCEELYKKYYQLKTQPEYEPFIKKELLEIEKEGETLE